MQPAHGHGHGHDAPTGRLLYSPSRRPPLLASLGEDDDDDGNKEKKEREKEGLPICRPRSPKPGQPLADFGTARKDTRCAEQERRMATRPKVDYRPFFPAAGLPLNKK
jgi:hypothetical protein